MLGVDVRFVCMMRTGRGLFDGGCRKGTVTLGPQHDSDYTWAFV